MQIKLKQQAVVKYNKPEACNPINSLEYQQISSEKPKQHKLKLNDALAGLLVKTDYLSQMYEQAEASKHSNKF